MVVTFLSGGHVPPVEEVGRNGVEQHLRGPNLGGVNPISPPLVETTARYQWPRAIPDGYRTSNPQSGSDVTGMFAWLEPRVQYRKVW
jgi:hypothetical protein